MFGGEYVAFAAIPGGTLDPKTVPKYVSPLVIPPAMPNTGTAHTYSIAVKQFGQQILPPPFPQTTVWSYGASNNLGTLNYPAFTIEAVRGTPTNVTWINGLVDGSGNYLPHLLPVDPTLHWANPPGGISGRDMRPTFTATPGPYTGPVPIVTHVHGMEGVEDWSDGYAEAWYLPNAINIPAGYAPVGTWYDFFNEKAGASWALGTAAFEYPNSQRPSTAWYHDHTLGMTRLNVYAGPAGLYIVRSENPADNPTSAGGGAAVLPGPAPQLGDPQNTRYYEIPLAVQDRSFDLGGELFYPNNRAFFDGFIGPFIPLSDVSPIWNPEFFGNHMVVNGQTWPFLEVEPRHYRFRLLNGCQSRFLILSFDDPKVDIWQIGNEGGFLRSPVQLKEILMSPAERADIIVDFSQVKFGKSVKMINRGPDAPYGGGGFRPSDPQTTGQVMQFNVNIALTGIDSTTPPAQLVLPGDIPQVLPTPDVTRGLALLEKMSTTLGVPPIPVEALLGIKAADPNANAGPGIAAPPGFIEKLWMDEITENPELNTVETWEIYNFTADAHPIHIHEVFFQVINRQRLDKHTGLPIQNLIPPAPWENGYKDTVIAYPGEVTRVQMEFGMEGQFVWHCHIVEHEDNEMMRPYRIGNVQPGQPG
ncbi:MAG: bilirubin oxidase [Desulfatitalea sp. BRH_c12]|nr:MAG: bilirubin oxidase [Desulfatitalea sp. BRH_c12]